MVINTDGITTLTSIENIRYHSIPSKLVIWLSPGPCISYVTQCMLCERSL
uniref:Uncharacterized protein n=1 Tax=Anguilla anguilla TaxID=7936 RepID=A0A0E9WVX2_ANGAN